MTKRITIAVLMASMVLFACNANGSSDKKSSKSSANNAASVDVSYAFGLAVGSDLKQTGLRFNYNAFVEGMRDSLEDRKARMTLEEAIAKLQAAFQEQMAKEAQENSAKEEAFLSENAGKPGVITTESGLQYEIIKQGSGRRPAANDTVLVNYEGRLIDGTVFDSSFERGEPVQFPLNQVIPGWTEGIQLMTVGSTYRLYIPSRLAYGEQGAGGMIPPNSALIFEVEFMDILK